MASRKLATLTIIVVLILLPASTFAWSGKCVGIQDGDTITVLTEGKLQVRIRLYGIDCPESGQAFGTKAKQYTADLVFKKDVEIKSTDTDRYGRIVAWVYVGEICVNEEILKAGLAWHYKKYSKEKHLSDLEDQARERKIGLWSDPHCMPPWEWRRKKPF